MSSIEFDADLVARISGALAQDNGRKARDLAEAIAAPYPLVKDHLVELEKSGIVYRTGRTRGTRWWLG